MVLLLHHGAFVCTLAISKMGVWADVPEDGLPEVPQKKKSLFQRLNPLPKREVAPVPAQRQPSPEFTANWFSRLSFGWMTPIMVLGHRRKLEKNDIWLVNPERNVKSLRDKFRTAFKNHLRKRSKHPLAAALHETFKVEFWIGGACLMTANLAQVFIPFTLRFLLNFVAAAYEAATAEDAPNHPGPAVGRGLGLVFAILIMQVLQSVCTNQFIYRGFMVGSQARAVLVAELFDKSLSISDRARASSDGSIMTLMSSDTARIDQAAGLFHLMWASPITILLTFALLIINLSYSAVPGFGLLFFGIAGLTFALKSLISKRKQINVTTDARVTLTQEMLRSVRFIKNNAWEDHFLGKLKELRDKESSMLVRLQLMRNVINSVSISLPIFGAMLSFITYSTTGNGLVVAPIFSSLALFNALRVPFNLLPVVIGQVADAWSALTRLEKFFLAEDHREDSTWDVDSDNAIKIDNADFTWESSTKSGAAKAAEKKGAKKNDIVPATAEMEALPFALRGVNLSVRKGELLAIIGSVGSGKTSLLSALAGEMRKTTGDVTLGASSRAFCPQDAWIQNATVKDNITFGRPYNHVLYNKVLDSCSLRPDIAMLAAGDATEIGERGINLSGGQRQRINLARAMYSDSDIVLMDDPLSAVDAHVGKHIFEQGICGSLKSKTRVLSTHALHILGQCDRVMWLENGQIRALGPFRHLEATNPEFKAMIDQGLQNKNRQEDEKKSPEEEEFVKNYKRASLELTKQMNNDGSLVKDEESIQGGRMIDVYKAFIRASGHLAYGFVPIILLLVAQGANTLTSQWLSFWTANKFHLSREDYIGIYVGIAVAQALLFFVFGAMMSILGGRASRDMVFRATSKVMAAPLAFHDTQPLGRIINRLSRDAEVMDNQLSEAIRMFIYTLAIVLSIVVLLSYYFPWFLVALGPLTILVLYATAYYRSSASQMKRHEASLRSVMFAKFGESVTGVSTIRAYGAQARAVQRVHDAIDDMDSAHFLTLSNQRWVTSRLDLVAASVVAIVGLLVVLLRTSVEPSVSGLVLSYVLSITQMMQLVVRSLSEVENAMVSTERLHEYEIDLPQEQIQTGSVPESWPSRGEIQMKDIVMRYRPELPPVLRGLNMSIRAGEKIGIVGRTGAGKSSISAALFRLTELSAGSITIDGLDISQIPLKELRSRISVIPQDPNLFQGTIRSNLDPFEQHTDLELWNALRRSGVQGHSDSGAVINYLHLDSPVEEEGRNISKGQRQLIALARALVRDCRIVVCDEATSSVDLETDNNIQKTIMEAFTGKTVLTIAHRLETIAKYDKVCVLEQGRVIEFDSPLGLWESRGAFRALCDRSRIGRSDFF